MSVTGISTSTLPGASFSEFAFPNSKAPFSLDGEFRIQRSVVVTGLDFSPHFFCRQMTPSFDKITTGHRNATQWKLGQSGR